MEQMMANYTLLNPLKGVFCTYCEEELSGNVKFVNKYGTSYCTTCITKRANDYNTLKAENATLKGRIEQLELDNKEDKEDKANNELLKSEVHKSLRALFKSYVINDETYELEDESESNSESDDSDSD